MDEFEIVGWKVIDRLYSGAIGIINMQYVLKRKVLVEKSIDSALACYSCHRWAVLFCGRLIITSQCLSVCGRGLYFGCSTKSLHQVLLAPAGQDVLHMHYCSDSLNTIRTSQQMTLFKQLLKRNNDFGNLCSRTCDYLILKKSRDTKD